MDPHAVSQDDRAKEIESVIPETEMQWDRVEKVLAGTSVDLDPTHTNPELKIFLETVARVAQNACPATWAYAAKILAETDEGDSYRDEASHMLRYTMGYETAIPATNNLPNTPDPVANCMRSAAIAELQRRARNARRPDGHN
jgi:hypothetical protein